MNSDAVIGCSAVETTAEWLRLRTATGDTRTIPWSSIRLAGVCESLDGHVTTPAVTRKVAPYLPTHASLWVFYEHGIAQVMLEKPSARQDAIYAAFAEHLGERWQGDELKRSDLDGAMMIPPKRRVPGWMGLAMTVLAIAFFLSVGILFFLHGARPGVR
jgi:hypothetical protein